MDYHLPQDSVGVHFTSTGMTFGLADGVSLVHKTLDNDSAVLSHHIVLRCNRLSGAYWPKQLDDVCTQFTSRNYIGSSTVVWGRIENESATTKLKTLLVGEQYDMGITRLITTKGLIEISNASSGFIPNGYKPSTEELFLPTPYTLCISSDGVDFSDRAWSEFSQYQLFNEPLESVADFLSQTIEPNRDDQSLLIVSTSDKENSVL